MATLDEKPTEECLENENHYASDQLKMSIGQYIVTRVPTLMPPMTKVANPFKLLGFINRQQWLLFLV